MFHDENIFIYSAIDEITLKVILFCAKHMVTNFFLRLSPSLYFTFNLCNVRYLHFLSGKVNNKIERPT